MWSQIYDPFGNMALSTVLAAVPVVAMLASLAFFHIKAHWAAGLGVGSAFVIAVLAFGMPAGMAGSAVTFGFANGLLPIGWIVLNIIFLHQLTEENGSFKVLQDSIASITEDRRLQLLMIAFSFGAFFEGAAGFGTPVAVTAAILIGLGFRPLAASGLSLIANTAPVAYGALGTPIITLAKVHGYDQMAISAMVGRQLPFFSLLVPFWLIWAFAGRRGMLEIWPAILVTGVSFAIPQFIVSNFFGPELVDVVAAMCSMAALFAFLKVWKPKEVWRSTAAKGHEKDSGEVDAAAVAEARNGIFAKHDRRAIMLAWMPWVVLTVVVFLWGLPAMKNLLNGIFAPKFPWNGLHEMVMRVPPVVPEAHAEGAVFSFNLLSATGSGILLSAIIGALLMKYNPLQIVRTYGRTLWLVKFSLLTIMLMFGLGFLTRYSGLDTTLGLAFAGTGVLYPFFGTMMGWLGVALTGSDTSSNVLFGGMQKVAAEQLGLSPTLMGAANSSGGVMGKMIDAQSIVVASTATRWFHHEGDILRYVFFHSIALAALVGVLVFLQAYVWPFTLMVVM